MIMSAAEASRPFVGRSASTCISRHGEPFAVKYAFQTSIVTLGIGFYIWKLSFAVAFYWNENAILGKEINGTSFTEKELIETQNCIKSS